MWLPEAGQAQGLPLHGPGLASPVTGLLCLAIGLQPDKGTGAGLTKQTSSAAHRNCCSPQVPASLARWIAFTGVPGRGGKGETEP